MKLVKLSSSRLPLSALLAFSSTTNQHLLSRKVICIGLGTNAMISLINFFHGPSHSRLYAQPPEPCLPAGGRSRHLCHSPPASCHHSIVLSVGSLHQWTTPAGHICWVCWSFGGTNPVPSIAVENSCRIIQHHCESS